MKKNSHIIRKGIAFLLFLLLMITNIGPVISIQAADSAFKVKVTMGYDGRQEIGIHVPITIEITNNGEDFDGSIQLTLPGKIGNVMYEQELNLAKGATKKVEMAPEFYTTNGMQIKIAIVNKKGKAVYEDLITTNITTSRDFVRVGVLSDDSAVARIFDKKYFDNSNYTSLALNVLELTAEDIYDKAEAMECLDVIVISNFATDTLSEGQIEAILDWAQAGGLLLFGTGDSYNKVLAGFKGKLDYKDKGLIQVTTDFASASIGLSGADKYFYQNLVRTLMDSYTLNKLTEVIISDENAGGIIKNVYSEIEHIVKYKYQVNFSSYNTDLWDSIYNDKIYNVEAYSYIKQLYYEVIPSANDVEDSDLREFAVNVVFNAIAANYYWNLSGDPGFLTYIAVPQGSLSSAPQEEEKAEAVKATLWDFEFGSETVTATDPTTQKEHTVFKNAAYGKGYIVMAAMDFSKKPFVSYSGNSVLVSMMEELIGTAMSNRFNEYNNLIWSWGGSSNYDVLLANAQSNKPVPVLVYGLVFIVYIAACFSLYFVLKKKKKTILLWPIIGAASLIAALMIYFISFSTKELKPVMNVVKFVNAGDNTGRVVNYCALSLPKNKKYGFELSDGFSVQYKDISESITVAQDDLNKYRIAFKEKNGRQEIVVNCAEILSKVCFTATEKNYQHGEIEFTGQYSRGNITGSITNNFGYDLTDCSILLEACVIPIGTLKMGETIDLSTLQPEGTMKPNSWDAPYIRRDKYIFGDNDNQSAIAIGVGGNRIVEKNARSNAITCLVAELGISGLSDYSYYINSYVPNTNNLPDIITDRLVFVGFCDESENIIGGNVKENNTVAVYKEANQ